MRQNVCVLLGEYSPEQFTEFNYWINNGKYISKNIGQYISIGLIFGLSRILGDLVIKTALLKLHLWSVEYYSPLFKSMMSYILYLDYNPLIDIVSDKLKTKVPYNPISLNKFTNEYF